MKNNNPHLSLLPTHFGISYRQTGVASIEYALITALIAVVILGTLQFTGSANGGIWGDWTKKFITAVNSAIRP